MTVRIRLRRTGRRNRACFRLCAMDARAPRDGRDLEVLGFYDPVAPRIEDQLRIDAERVRFWLERGASLSETARALCLRAGIELPAPGKSRRRKHKKSPGTQRRKLERKRKLLKAKQERRLARLEAARAKAAAEAESSS